MCFFKRKKKEVITNNKFQIGEWIRFSYKGEVNPGVIYDMHLDEDGNVIYDVKIGGECPIVISNIKEEKIIKKK